MNVSLTEQTDVVVNLIANDVQGYKDEIIGDPSEKIESWDMSVIHNTQRPEPTLKKSLMKVVTMRLGNLCQGRKV